MWKYRCKSQLITLLVAFGLGAVLSLFTWKSNLGFYQSVLSEEMFEMISGNQILICISGGLGIAGFANVFLISRLLMSQFNLSPIIIFFALFLFPDYILIAGVIMVIPMLIASIYGMISLKYDISRESANQKLASQQELVRIYSIHHKLDESVKPLAEACRKNVDKMTYLYILGLVAIACIIIFVDNYLIWMVALFGFMYIFNVLLRYRAQSVMPINALLYDKCDPEACASAIIYFSTKRGKIKIKNQILMAQCLIYLDDPQLAQDFLITYPRKDASSSLTYWSLMAYINYLLKDEDALHRCKEEAGKIRLGMGQTGVMIQSAEQASIQNKIDLMDGEFNTCKKFYLQVLQQSQFNFQIVDASYYIALISFVEEDYVVAQVYFNKVLQLGNKTCFVKKAQHYQDQIDAMHLNLESEESEFTA